MDLIEYVRKHNKTHIIFDFDATLFLLILPWVNWYDGLKKKLLEVDPMMWDAYEQGEFNNATVQNAFIENHGDTIRKFLNDHSEAFEVEQLERHEPNTDLLASLGALRDVKKYVWSSNTRPTLQTILEETELAHHFEQVVTRQDVDFVKPKPDGFYKIYDESVPKERYLMVGDSSHDRGGAEAAGIDFYHTDFFNVGA